jgi:Spy/CpxP family protein refolding chaperone
MNKIGFLTLLILATVLITLALSAAAAAPKAPAQPAAAAPAPSAAAVPQEKHPHIHAGLEAMREAKRQMEAAASEYHGHRAKSIEHLNQAIHEAEICMQEP